jgi:glycosyltransferase involved in cell wall biosynthesis
MGNDVMDEIRTAPWVVISPVRNEAQLIRLTLDSMINQTVLPQEWLIVDDGSTDQTAAIVEEYAVKHPWIRLVRRQDRGFRQLGSGVIAAFDFGRGQLRTADWQFISKLDGDMSFPPTYAEAMIDALEREPTLACVSGKVFRPEAQGLVEEFILDEATAGQFKFYRREPFEQIGGFGQTILWDGIDWHRCRMRGWNTRSFHDPAARLIHHRLMGSSDRNVYKGRIRLGRGIWFMGYTPSYALASGVFRMRERPRAVGGLIIIAAYFWAALRREPQLPDPEFRRYLRQWQHRQLIAVGLRPLRRVARGVGASLEPRSPGR